jgi:PadR family transcriptional regulator PadR
MSQNHLAEFEEIVLLTVSILDGNAYGLNIIEEIDKRINRRVSLGAIQTVLKRLEEKKFLKSEFGEATKIRGGKRKRYYSITGEGRFILKETKEQRMGLWEAIPTYSLQILS